MQQRHKTKLILASKNRHKIKEIKKVLSGLNLEIIFLDAFPDISEITENESTIEANAEKKARTVYEATGIMSLADDTGLEVEYLDGKPGVYSSRFAGTDADDEMNNKKLLKLLQGVPWEERRAKFRCIMAIVDDSNLELLEGNCHGYILEEERGQNGFGYDPLFFIPEYKQTFAEMPLSFKNKVSHRGKALQKVRKYLENIT